ncbi:MAG: hypothetical protein AAFU79_36270, partial [Myxococcota bacterium]
MTRFLSVIGLAVVSPTVALAESPAWVQEGLAIARDIERHGLILSAETHERLERAALEAEGSSRLSLLEALLWRRTVEADVKGLEEHLP